MLAHRADPAKLDRLSATGNCAIDLSCNSKILDVSRKKLPFGIAQIGKAFRNEINPRNFTFRSREFEQMELEYFCRPEQGMELLEYWKRAAEVLREHRHLTRKPARPGMCRMKSARFIPKALTTSNTISRLGGRNSKAWPIAPITICQQHQKASGKSLEYFDEETKEKFIPHVVEPSAGVDRTVLALICEAYDEDQAPDEKGRNGNAHRDAIFIRGWRQSNARFSAAEKQGAAGRESA
jgi:glycyl-tRNA synthetase